MNATISKCVNHKNVQQSYRTMRSYRNIESISTYTPHNVQCIKYVGYWKVYILHLHMYTFGWVAQWTCSPCMVNDNFMGKTICSWCEATTNDYDEKKTFYTHQMTHICLKTDEFSTFIPFIPFNQFQKWTSKPPLESVLDVMWSRNECENNDREKKEKIYETSLTMEELKKERQNKTFVIRNIKRNEIKTNSLFQLWFHRWWAPKLWRIECWTLMELYSIVLMLVCKVTKIQKRNMQD